MLGSQQIFLELPEETEDYEELVEIMSNTQLNVHFLALAREVCELHSLCINPLKTSPSILGSGLCEMCVIAKSNRLQQVNPKRTGGGGLESTPSTFCAIISRKFFARTALFAPFFFESCTTFDAISVKIWRTVPKLRNIM